MSHVFCLLAGLLASLSVMAQIPVPSPDLQVNTALLAAPADKRTGATVYGYSPKNEFILLRKGTNELICLTDDPNQKGFSASCYHRDLEPFMLRGRDLKKQGKTPQEINTIREQDVKAGKWKMPSVPTTLYVFSAQADNYEVTSGEVKQGSLRYVVYIPYATAESTGLSLKPELPGMPWLMDAGTHRAHIMISPSPPTN